MAATIPTDELLELARDSDHVESDRIEKVIPLIQARIDGYADPEAVPKQITNDLDAIRDCVARWADAEENGTAQLVRCTTVLQRYAYRRTMLDVVSDAEEAQRLRLRPLAA